MNGAIAALKREFASLQPDVHGILSSRCSSLWHAHPLPQCEHQRPERLLSISVWDNRLCRMWPGYSGFGLGITRRGAPNPPPVRLMSNDALARVAAQYGETTRVAKTPVRRMGWNFASKGRRGQRRQSVRSTKSRKSLTGTLRGRPMLDQSRPKYESIKGGGEPEIRPLIFVADLLFAAFPFRRLVAGKERGLLAWRETGRSERCVSSPLVDRNRGQPDTSRAGRGYSSARTSRRANQRIQSLSTAIRGTVHCRARCPTDAIRPDRAGSSKL